MDWGKNDSSDPNDASFCLSLNGEKLFVVGLHPESSRFARRFSRPAMVFNTLSQFEQFENDGTYTAMVHTIRRRDLKFQGSINPMVLAMGMCGNRFNTLDVKIQIPGNALFIS